MSFCHILVTTGLTVSTAVAVHYPEWTAFAVYSSFVTNLVWIYGGGAR